MIIPAEQYLAHYGVARRSGRYPWGSGGLDEASSRSLLGAVDHLKKQGMSETDIAKGFDMTTTQLRALKSIANNQVKQANIGMAQRLKDKGYHNVAIGERMGINESSVRSLLAPGAKDKADVLQSTSKMLKDEVDKKGLIDVGTGVEYHIGVSKDKLNTAVSMLQEQGYKLHYLKVKQLGTGKETTMKVLSPPGVPYSEVFKNRGNVQQVGMVSSTRGRDFEDTTPQPPLSVSSKRVGVRYKEEGGAEADGVIYVRPGVDDVSLGKSKYAQVRIAVDGTHYLKGMAMYRDDLPEGVDLLFNTNKSSTGNKLDAMKKMKDDPENPFGATVRQIKDEATGKVKSAMNLVNEEGRWNDWSRNLSTQMLSKQSPNLAKQQLDMTFERKRMELDAIKRLTNPVVRQKLLDEFAEGADSSAVHLKAAALPRQSTHVILPINTLKDSEVYAPNFKDGERVVLIRYPHGGTFEIPELRVNNKHPDAKKAMGNAPDAIGINAKVAERLSGADFDGDTVLVIPNNKGAIKSSPALQGLKNFDPQTQYKAYEGMKRMTTREKQTEMGLVSNLITDMTIHGASNEELARAVRHSMVVIDAEKHNLNFKQSALDNGIKQLNAKYQNRAQGGASTLISRATSPVRIPERKPRAAADGGPIDRATGELRWQPTGATYTNKKGVEVLSTTRSTKLGEAKDANTLSSGSVIEKIYADHSNRLKAMANEARREMVNTQTIPYSPSAKKVYAKEVGDLNAKLNVALKNAPLERQAQVLANAKVAMKREANPDLDADELKKIKSQALIDARNKTGAGKTRIEITDSEWAAIQAGAISTDKLRKILNNADIEQVKQLATPRTQTGMTTAQQSRARSMLQLGYTQAEVAEQLGVSTSTLNRMEG